MRYLGHENVAKKNKFRSLFPRLFINKKNIGQMNFTLIST